jgi:hypothetical protein
MFSAFRSIGNDLLKQYRVLHLTHTPILTSSTEQKETSFKKLSLTTIFIKIATADDGETADGRSTYRQN